MQSINFTGQVISFIGLTVGDECVYRNLINFHGGRTKNQITSKVTYIVKGYIPTELEFSYKKLLIATELRIPVITEIEFIKRFLTIG